MTAALIWIPRACDDCTIPDWIGYVFIGMLVIIVILGVASLFRR